MLKKYKPYFGMTFPSMWTHICFQVRLPNVFDRGKTFHFHAWILQCFSSLTLAIIYSHWCILDSKKIHSWRGWLLQLLSPFPAERNACVKQEWNISVFLSRASCWKPQTHWQVMKNLFLLPKVILSILSAFLSAELCILGQWFFLPQTLPR